jgi:tRNA G37 N-methylase TrmD
MHFVANCSSLLVIYELIKKKILDVDRHNMRAFCQKQYKNSDENKNA